MNYRSTPHEIEARQFQGESLHFQDEDALGVTVYKSMRGYFVRRRQTDGGTYQFGIALGDWIVTKPTFMIIPDARFKLSYEEIGDSKDE